MWLVLAAIASGLFFSACSSVQDSPPISIGIPQTPIRPPVVYPVQPPVPLPPVRPSPPVVVQPPRPPQPVIPPVVVKPPVTPPPVRTVSNRVQLPNLPVPTLKHRVLGNDWVSFEAWGMSRGKAEFSRFKEGQTVVHRLSIAGQTVELMANDRRGEWQGAQFWLGFSTKFFQEHLYVHQIDIQKLMEPLMGRLPQLGRVVVIDPGHGKDNHGTKSVHDQKLEKELTLDWALRLKPLLEARGWKVHLTRTKDSEVSLEDRVAFADKNKAALFISLHFNHASPEVQGLETYCIAPVGVPAHLTRGPADQPKVALVNNQYDTRNVQLAAVIHKSMIEQCEMADRGVRRVRFMTVLKTQKRPAILIEGGYLSNPEESRRIATPEYRQKLAVAVASALQ